MSKKSKVTDVIFISEYDSKYGKLYKFAIEFENGDTGDYSSKKKEQDKFVIGEEAEYTINKVGDYTNIKPEYSKPESIGTGTALKQYSKPVDLGLEHLKIRSILMSYVKDMIVADAVTTYKDANELEKRISWFYHLLVDLVFEKKTEQLDDTETDTSVFEPSSLEKTREEIIKSINILGPNKFWPIAREFGIESIEQIENLDKETSEKILSKLVIQKLNGE
jgi:hypothetical protein